MLFAPSYLLFAAVAHVILFTLDTFSSPWAALDAQKMWPERMRYKPFGKHYANL